MNYQDQIRNNEGMAEDMFDNYVSEQERQDEKRKELIVKFANGWARYNREPLFRSVLDALVRGADPFEIIEKLIDHNVELAEKWRQAIENSTSLP